MPKRNIVKGDSFHYKWSNGHEPVLTVKPGDRVTFQVNEVTSSQITPKSHDEDLLSMDSEKMYPLSGPVKIEGARPGDALSVSVLAVKPAKWGWSAVIPGMGLLEEFDKPFLHLWNLSNGKFARLKKGINIPLKPFCGVHGVAPNSEGELDVMPPGPHGGNMDNRHLTAGSRLLLPIWVDGALFSVGDLHAAQGDGEVCVTAIECPGEVTIRFDLVRELRISSPEYVIYERGERRSYYGTTGISPDLWQAAKLSVRNMIAHLCKEYDLTREEAYILCSVAADLRIHEIVDKPNWVVGTTIPLDLFEAGRRR